MFAGSFTLFADGDYGCVDVCDDCRFQPQETISRILALMRRTEKQLTDVQLVCATCSGTPTTEPIHCESLDCPWLFERKKVEHRTEGLETIQDIVDDLQYYVDEFADSEGNFEVSTLSYRYGMSEYT